MKNFNGNFSGGITAGIVALPLALAFGVQSGLGTAAGLYGAIALGLAGAWFGGTPTLIRMPTGPVTVVSLLIISGMGHQTGNLNSAIGTILAVFLLAGCFQVVFGLLRVGNFVQFVPAPVLSGFITGLGILLVVFELYPMMGLPSPQNALDILAGLSQALPQAHPQALFLAGLTVAIIYLTPQFTRAAPGTLVALLVGTAVAATADFAVPLVSDRADPPTLKLDLIAGASVHNVLDLLLPALTLAFVGITESLRNSAVLQSKSPDPHQSDQELVGQGVGNMLSGILGGLPGAATPLPTLANMEAGRGNRISSVISSAFLLTVLLGAGTHAGAVPIPVLAGILLSVGVDTIDYQRLKQIARLPKTESIVMLTVMILTVFADLVSAVGIGMGMVFVLLVKRMNDLGMEQTMLAPLNSVKPNRWGVPPFLPTLADMSSPVYVTTLKGPVNGSFASSLGEKLKQSTEPRIVILKMNRVPYIDQTGLFALEEAILELNRIGIEVFIASIRRQPLEMLTRHHIVPWMIPPDNMFRNTYECVKWLGRSRPATPFPVTLRNPH